jgi:hypothetical protein
MFFQIDHLELVLPRTSKEDLSLSKIKVLVSADYNTAWYMEVRLVEYGRVTLTDYTYTTHDKNIYKRHRNGS